MMLPSSENTFEKDANTVDSTVTSVGSASMKGAKAVFERLDSGYLPELLTLEKACFASPWSEEQFNLALEQKLFNVFGLVLPATATEPRQLLAYLSLYHVADEMEIFNLAVDKSFRRQGLARRLLGLVLQIGRRMGIRYTFLEVRVGNVPARNLYGSFGFEQVGLRKGYYPDNGEDALILRLELNNETASREASPSEASTPDKGATNEEQ